MKKDAIPEKIKKEVKQIIKDFNKEEFEIIEDFYKYVAEFKGSYLYLNTQKYDLISPVARLKYTGNMNKWEFAIYKYSTQKYDREEWFFNGVEYVDGTIIGALKAGIMAYPPM